MPLKKCHWWCRFVVILLKTTQIAFNIYPFWKSFFEYLVNLIWSMSGITLIFWCNLYIYNLICFFLYTFTKAIGFEVIGYIGGFLHNVLSHSMQVEQGKGHCRFNIEMWNSNMVLVLNCWLRLRECADTIYFISTSFMDDKSKLLVAVCQCSCPSNGGQDGDQYSCCHFDWGSRNWWLRMHGLAFIQCCLHIFPSI